MITISIDPIIFSIGHLMVRWYSLIVTFAIVVGVWMTWREAKRKGLDEKHFGVPLLVHLLRKNTEAHTALS